LCEPVQHLSKLILEARGIDAYQKMCEKKGEPVDPESPKGKRIAWARGKADWFDPLKP